MVDLRTFRLLPFLAATLASGHAAETRPLIPREVLFADTARGSVQLSPDGKHVSYVASSTAGVPNLWLRPVGGGEDRMVTPDSLGGVGGYRWGPDGRRVLLWRDTAGDENTHLWTYDIETGKARDLTPFAGVRVWQVETSPDHPGILYVSLNKRDRRVFDLHRIDLETGELSLEIENPGDCRGWLADADFRFRFALASKPDGTTVLRVRDADGAWRDRVRWPFGETVTFHQPQGGSDDLPAVTTVGADTARAVLFDAATGREKAILAEDPRCDAEGVLIHPRTKKIQAVLFDHQKPEWRVLDPDVKEDFAALARACPGRFEVMDRDRADAVWLVRHEADDIPPRWLLYRREGRLVTLLFSERPDLEPCALARTEPAVIPARDGLKLVSYLTRPAGVSKDASIPLVVLPHGGPWSRDRWRFSERVQWLADRGYAVLQVNFRGSVGFGKRHMDAGDGQWGPGGMLQDLLDGVRWAVERGGIDGDRVALMGRSFGGHMTLSGLAFAPKVFRCGVAEVGPANLKTFSESVPAYWHLEKGMFVRRVGDVEHDEALNRKLSPFFHADRMTAPLLLAQGANDPRVNRRESDQMAAALRKAGRDVAYVVYAGEGHGLRLPANRLDFYGRAEEFLAKHLGGRAEPWKAALGSTVESN